MTTLKFKNQLTQINVRWLYNT